MLTVFIIILNVVIFLLQLSGTISISDFGLIPQFVKGGQFYRLFTSAFLHGSFQHILANMYSLFNLGYYLEMRYGKKNLFLVSLVSLFTSAIAVTLFSNQTIPTIGYSCVVFGVMWYYFVSVYANDKRIDQNEMYVIVRMLLPNIIISLMPGVSAQGHFGGLIGGVLTALILLKRHNW